ncbi:large ribosomal subunit protein uL29m [Hetaerina americana]|uniref:large ribosomal subunit protein uL29m n=1 Tax=Hetaerina americana TaxID=62018 RepID=UPI003A7F430D
MAFIKCVQTLCARTKLALKTCASGSIVERFGSRHFGKSVAMSCNAPNTTEVNPDEINKRLMEFFDDQKNWGENEIKVGRAWCKDELRIKSNTDLHKLWFVLLKEKNMLLSMEHESKEMMRLFPNPERLDKVEESMTNLEEVVRERNRAYYMLETGEDGERPVRLVINRLGIRFFYKMKERAIPHQRNLKWWRGLQVGHDNPLSVGSFLRLYREQLYLAKKRKRTRNLNHVQHLMRRFPHLDLEAVRKQYPEVDLEKARIQRRAYGSHEFNS